MEIDVLPGPEGTADAGGMGPHLVRAKPQARHHLFLVDVDVLAGGEEIDTTVTVGDRQTGLGPQWRLILHADLVEALDDHRATRPLLATSDPHPPEHLTCGIGDFGVDEGLEHLVLHLDRCRGAAGRVLVLGGDNGHGLPPESNDLTGQHGLVGMLETKVGPTRDLGGRQDGMDPTYGQSRGHFDRDYSCMGMWATCGCAPEHLVGFEVLGVLELALELGDAIGTQRRGPDAADHRRRSSRGPGSHLPPPAMFSRARMMAPYPVHRQMLPARASLISARFGAGFRANRSAAVTTIPGVQKPHCTAPASCIAR